MFYYDPENGTQGVGKVLCYIVRLNWTRPILERRICAYACSQTVKPGSITYVNCIIKYLNKPVLAKNLGPLAHAYRRTCKPSLHVNAANEMTRQWLMIRPFPAQGLLDVHNVNGSFPDVNHLLLSWAVTRWSTMILTSNMTCALSVTVVHVHYNTQKPYFVTETVTSNGIDNKHYIGLRLSAERPFNIHWNIHHKAPTL